MTNSQATFQSSNQNTYGYLESLNEIVKIDTLFETMTKGQDGRFDILQDISQSSIIPYISIDRSKSTDNGFCIFIETDYSYILSKKMFLNYDKTLSESGNFYIYTNPYQFSNIELYELGLYRFFEHCINTHFENITYVSDESRDDDKDSEYGQEYAEYEYAY